MAVSASWTDPTSPTLDLLTGQVSSQAWTEAIASNFNYLGGPSGSSPTAGLMVRIGDTLLSSSATNITFASIPGTFKHLMITGQARADGAVTLDQLLAQFNADTSGNYDWQETEANSAGAFFANGLASTSARIGLLPGTTVGLAAGAAALSLTIPNYASTTFNKSWLAMCGTGDSTATNSSAGIFGGDWRNTAAITSIKLFPGMSTNFVAGTRFTLYGLN